MHFGNLCLSCSRPFKQIIANPKLWFCRKKIDSVWFYHTKGLSLALCTTVIVCLVMRCFSCPYSI